MYLQQVFLHGFKSYEQRTSIDQWDPQFNCITGFNGSGKSNILDAICFVLGIERMADVRAENKIDLIYGRGRTGTTSASVTLVFNNTDKNRSTEIEEYRNQPTISVTRTIQCLGVGASGSAAAKGVTSKYLINGRKAEARQVKALFQSVQLNIDKPNFLIMQGKVTKVLSMKPEEFLAHIEEAVGTSTFQQEADKSKKKLVKCDQQLEYNEKLLSDDIAPKLERLQEQAHRYTEMEHALTRLETTQKKLGAHDYLQLIANKDLIHDELMQTQTRVSELNAAIKENQTLLSTANTDLEALQNQETTSGDAELDSAHSDAHDQVTRLETSLELANTELKNEQRVIKNTHKDLEKAQHELKSYSASVDAFKGEYERVKAERDDYQVKLENKSELYSSLQSGVSGSGGADSGFSAEKRSARESILQHEQIISRQEKRRKNLEHEISIGQYEDAKKKTANASRELEEIEKQLSQLTQELKSPKYDEVNHYEQLISRKAQLEKNIRGIEVEMDRMRSQNIDFRDPNFTRDQVLGRVGSLFSIKANEENKSEALEQCAGGRLYNVVVSSDEVGTKLLNSGQKRRLTLLPLNKIQGYVIQKDKVKRAKLKAGESNLELALDAVDYPTNLAPAMKHVFGSTYIANDPSTAEKVVWDNDVKARTITLEGDVYDPHGTLTGGSKTRSSGVLRSFQKFAALRAKRDGLLREFQSINKNIEALQALKNEYSQIKKKYDLCEHQRALLIEKAGSDAASMTVKRYENNSEECLKCQEEIESSKLIVAQQQERLAKAERDEEEYSQNKEGKLNEIKKEITALRRKKQDCEEVLKQRNDEYDEVSLKMSTLHNQIENLKQKIQTSEQNILDLGKSITESEQEKNAVEHKYLELDRKQKALQSHRQHLTTQRSSLEQDVSKFKSTISECELELVKQTQALEDLQSEHDKLEKERSKMEHTHSWLRSDRDLLGKEGTAYYFEDADISQLRDSLQVSHQQVSRFGGSVNKEDVHNFAIMKKQHEDVERKISQLKSDKRQIQQTIKELEVARLEKLKTEWTKVSDEMGNIFSDLLPGCTAWLAPVDETNFLKGLEVKVRIGNVDKDSLNELSGGQRSLAGMAFVLSLLKLNPAPVYILDEIDAALDMNHTQNIGRLIKTRFQGSQFIIISLKDGMFSNANQLFKVENQNGKSKVFAKKSLRL